MKNSNPDDAQKGEQSSPDGERFRGKTTPEILAALRKKCGYTLAEIGELSSTPMATVKAWSSGRFTPSEATRFRLIGIFTDPAVAPSRKVRREMDAHHLSWDEGKGWRFRFTLMLNRKQVGKRIQLRLRTTDAQEAIQRRELLCSCFRNLGLTVAGRKQVRKKAENSKQNVNVEASVPRAHSDTHKDQ